MATLRSATKFERNTVMVNGIILGDCGMLDADGNPTDDESLAVEYTWSDSRIPNGYIDADGNVYVLTEEVPDAPQEG